MLEKTFPVAGRTIPWLAALFGAGLTADAVWTAAQGSIAVAVVVGGVGLERLVYAGVKYARRRAWPFRIESVAVDEAGLTVGEVDVYSGARRRTTLPGGLILAAEVETTGTSVEPVFTVVLHTILGSFHWSEHPTRAEALTAAEAISDALPERALRTLQPPGASGRIEVLPAERGVMWSTTSVVPVSIIARGLLLLAAAAAVPALVEPPVQHLLVVLMLLVATLLCFPVLGAWGAVRTGSKVRASGASLRGRELLAWEASAPSHAVGLDYVRHVGWKRIPLDGRPVAIKLAALTRDGAAVESFVSRSNVMVLSEQCYRLLAEQYEVDRPSLGRPEWVLRLPGGFAEAIEAASWLQRFVAEARSDSGGDRD